MQPQSVTPLQAQFPVAPFKPLTKEDVASLLGISTRGVERWVESGIIPRWRKIGGRSYWHPDVIYGWLAARLKADEPDLVEDTAARPTLVRSSKGKAADSGVKALDAKRLFRIAQAAGTTASGRRAA